MGKYNYSAAEIEKIIGGGMLDDVLRDAQHVKNISDLRFYRWYIENGTGSEDWSDMLIGMQEYANNLEERSQTEDLDEVDKLTLEGFRTLFNEGPWGFLKEGEEASE